MSISHKKILVFLLLTLVLSTASYIPIAASGSTDGYILSLMWAPGVAAIITQLSFHRSLRGLGWRPGKPKYLFLGYGLPVIYGLILYGFVWLTGLGKFAPTEMADWLAGQWNIEIAAPYLVVAGFILTQATLGVLMSCLTALGEEIGWRGLLAPELATVTSFTKTAIISGGIWAVWHFPVMIAADYQAADTPLWFNLVFFTIGVMGISFPLTWLRLKSGSMWPAVLLHASHNLFFQVVFSPLTANTGVTNYVAGEFGLGFALVSLPVAWLFWRKRDELLPEEGRV